MEGYLASLSLGEESTQMWNLNKRLEAYLSRVKALEEENELLRAEIHQLKSTKSEKCWKKTFRDEMRKLRDVLDESHAEMVQAEMSRDSLCDEIEFIKERCLQERQAQEDAKKELTESKKVLEEERRAQIWLKEKLLQLEAELEDIVKLHEEEQELMEQEISSFSQRLENFKVAPVAFQPVDVNDYANKLSEIWQGAVEGYRSEVEELEFRLSEANDSLRKVLEENKQSKLLLQNLDKELLSLKMRKEMLEEVFSKQWQEQQEEEGQLQFEVESLEKEKKDLRSQISQVLEDRQQLMHLKMSLSLEVATYRSLLEAENTRIHNPGMDYKLSSTLNDSWLEQMTVRKRHNEDTKKFISRDYRLRSGKKQSGEKNEALRSSSNCFLNVKDSSFQKRTSPVTKEFQKVSSVLQSQSLNYVKAPPAAEQAPPRSAVENGWEKHAQSVDICKKTKTEAITNSYSLDSVKAEEKHVEKTESKAAPVWNYNKDHVKDNEPTSKDALGQIESNALSPSSQEALVLPLTADHVKDDHSVSFQEEQPKLDVPKHDLLEDIVSKIVLEDKAFETSESIKGLEEREVIGEGATFQREYFNKQELVESAVDGHITGEDKEVTEEVAAPLELNKETIFVGSLEEAASDLLQEITAHDLPKEITTFQSTVYEKNEFGLLAADNDNVSEIIQKTVGGLLGNNFKVSSVTEVEYVHYQEDGSDDNPMSSIQVCAEQWAGDSDGSLQPNEEEQQEIAELQDKETESAEFIQQEQELQMSEEGHIDREEQVSQVISALEQDIETDITEMSLQQIQTEEKSVVLNDLEEESNPIEDGQESPEIEEHQVSDEEHIDIVEAAQVSQVFSILKQDVSELSDIREEILQKIQAEEKSHELNDVEEESRRSTYGQEHAEIEEPAQVISAPEQDIESDITEISSQQIQTEEKSIALKDLEEESRLPTDDLETAEKKVYSDLKQDVSERSDIGEEILQQVKTEKSFELNDLEERRQSPEIHEIEEKVQQFIGTVAASQPFDIEDVVSKLDDLKQDIGQIAENEEDIIEVNTAQEEICEEIHAEQDKNKEESQPSHTELSKEDRDKLLNDEEEISFDDESGVEISMDVEQETKQAFDEEDGNVQSRPEEFKNFELTKAEDMPKITNTADDNLSTENSELYSEEAIIADGASQLFLGSEISLDYQQTKNLEDHEELSPPVDHTETNKEKDNVSTQEHNEINKNHAEIGSLDTNESDEVIYNQETDMSEDTANKGYEDVASGVEKKQNEIQDDQNTRDVEEQTFLQNENITKDIQDNTSGSKVQAEEHVELQEEGQCELVDEVMEDQENQGNKYWESSVNEDNNIYDNQNEETILGELNSDKREAIVETLDRIEGVYETSNDFKNERNDQDLISPESESAEFANIIELHGDTKRLDVTEQGVQELEIHEKSETILKPPTSSEDCQENESKFVEEVVDELSAGDFCPEKPTEVFEEVLHGEHNNEDYVAEFEVQAPVVEQLKESSNVVSKTDHETSESEESVDSQGEISLVSQNSEEINKDYHLEKTLPDITKLASLDNELEALPEDQVELTPNKTQDKAEELFEESEDSLPTYEFAEETEEKEATELTSKIGDIVPVLDDTYAVKAPATDILNQDTSYLGDTELSDDSMENAIPEDGCEDHIDSVVSQVYTSQMQTTEEIIGDQVEEPTLVGDDTGKDHEDHYRDFSDDSIKNILTKVSNVTSHELVSRESISTDINSQVELEAVDSVTSEQVSNLEDEEFEVKPSEESIFSESEESSSSDEGSPNITTTSHTSELEVSTSSITKEAFAEVEVTEEFTMASKPLENVLFQHEEKKEIQSSEQIIIEGPVSAPNNIVQLEFLASDHEKEVANESSDSSYDSNYAFETREFKQEETVEQLAKSELEFETQNNVNVDKVNGFQAHERLDLAEDLLNGHTERELNHSCKKGFILLEEGILDDSAITYAMSEGKSEGLFQTLLEKSEPKDLARDEVHLASESQKNTETSIYLDSADQYTKLVQNPYLNNKDVHDQSEIITVTASLTDKNIVETSQAISETHGEISGVNIQHSEDNSWSSHE
ncbi:nestin [Pelodytes ibericus]